MGGDGCQVRWPATTSCGWGTCVNGSCLCDDGYFNAGPMAFSDPTSSCDYQNETVVTFAKVVAALDFLVGLGCLVRFVIGCVNFWNARRYKSKIQLSERRTFQVNTALGTAFFTRAGYMVLVADDPARSQIGLDPVVTVLDFVNTASFWCAAYHFLSVFLEYTKAARKTSGIKARASSSRLVDAFTKHGVLFRNLGLFFSLLSTIPGIFMLATDDPDVHEGLFRLHLVASVIGADTMIAVLVADMTALLNDVDRNLSDMDSTDLGGRKNDSETTPTRTKYERSNSLTASFKKGFESVYKSMKGSSSAEQLERSSMQMQLTKMRKLKRNVGLFRGEVVRQGVFYTAMQSSFFFLPYLRNKLQYNIMVMWILVCFMGTLTFVILPVKLSKSKLGRGSSSSRVAPLSRQGTGVKSSVTSRLVGVKNGSKKSVIASETSSAASEQPSSCTTSST